MSELMHYGVLGMKWGVRREEKRQQKHAKRVSTYQRQSQNDKLALDIIALKNGRKTAERILDIMGKDSSKSLVQATNRYNAERIGKAALVATGALTVGQLLSMIGK